MSSASLGGKVGIEGGLLAWPPCAGVCPASVLSKQGRTDIRTECNRTYVYALASERLHVAHRTSNHETSNHETSKHSESGSWMCDDKSQT